MVVLVVMKVRFTCLHNRLLSHKQLNDDLKELETKTVLIPKKYM